MTSRRLLFLLPALFGYIALFTLFPRLDPSTRWNYSINRTDAIRIARLEASKLGYVTDDWDEKVTIRHSPIIEYYLRHQTDPIGAGIFSPLVTSVYLRNLRSNHRITVDLNSQGGMTGFRFSAPQTNPTENQKPGTQVANPSLSVSEEFLKKVLKNSFSRFSLSDAGSQDGNNRQATWVASDNRLRVTARVETKEDRVTGVSIEPTMTSEMREEMNARRSTAGRTLAGIGSFTYLPLALLIAIFYFTGLARRQIHHPTTLVFLVIAFLFTFFTNVISEFADSLVLGTTFSTGTVNYWVALLAPKLIFLLLNLGIAFGAYVTWSAGQALALRIPDRRTLSIELALKGKILTKPVTVSILAGVLAGGLLAALPYLVLATGIFPSAELATTFTHAYFVAQLPTIAAFTTGYEFLSLVLFAFLGSLIDSAIRRRALARGVLALLVFFAVQSVFQVVNSAPAMVVTGILATIVLLSLHYGFGVLAAVVAVICGQLSISAAAMMAQPSVSLGRSGWTIMVYVGVVLIAGFTAFLKSRETTPEETAVPEHLISGRIERERLKAEFDVARRAQEKMLPDAEPMIEGLDIAAICRPSKDVGGDLYDFLPIRDGRLGIVVADVSGKGVPASLYMTLTKGLLDSITETETDPGQILREVNRHLYDVCRRKVFVTLFLGIIDPVTRRFDFARAGHNPPVLFRQAENMTQLLKPQGMGLGLNSGRIFDQSLKVDSIDLKPGDLLLIYSDGITEAMNFKKEEFGEVRLEELAKGMNGIKAHQARDNVMAEVSRFLGNIPPQDDQTLVVVRVESKK